MKKMGKIPALNQQTENIEDSVPSAGGVWLSGHRSMEKEHLTDTCRDRGRCSTEVVTKSF